MRKSIFEPFIKKVVCNAKAVFLGPFSTFRINNICMWHAGRCGSTVMAEMIQKDGRIDWSGEILEIFSKKMMKEDEQKQKIIDSILRKINKRQKTTGKKDFGYEMKLWHYKKLDLHIDDILEINKKLNINKNIILERKNSLKIVVSSRLAKSSSVWHLTEDQKGKPSKTTIDVSDNHLLDVLGAHKEFYENIINKLSNDFLYLCYEDDIESDPTKGYLKICEYFNMEPRNIGTTLKKTNPGKLINKIENYNEVNEYLKGTPYHWMIHS